MTPQLRTEKLDGIPNWVISGGDKNSLVDVIKFA